MPKSKAQCGNIFVFCVVIESKYKKMGIGTASSIGVCGCSHAGRKTKTKMGLKMKCLSYINEKKAGSTGTAVDSTGPAQQRRTMAIPSVSGSKGSIRLFSLGTLN